MCFLGIFGDQRGRNLNIFLKSRKENGVLRWSAACLLACPLVAGVSALWGFRTCRRLALVLWSCVRCFCPLSRLVFGVLSLNMVLFRVFRGFLEGFGRFVWVYVVLVRCVACVALYACGVRRFYGLWRVCLSFCPFAFLLLLLCLPAFMLVVLLCSGCLSLSSCIVFVALWVWLLFPFPFRTIRKKRGRAVLVRPLFVCCGLLFPLLLFGFKP